MAQNADHGGERSAQRDAVAEGAGDDAFRAIRKPRRSKKPKAGEQLSLPRTGGWAETWLLRQGYRLHGPLKIVPTG